MTLDDAQLRERLQEALDHGGNLHTIEELASETRAGRMQCWHNDQACCFTQLEDRADGRVLIIYLAAGELEHVLQLQPQMFAFGRAEGCNRVYCTGRRGWRAILPAEGWREKYVVWERAL
jgi:hypothetical protein